MDAVERLSLDAAQADTMLAAEHRHRYEFAAALCTGRRVLDLCCGSGYGSEILAAAARSVTGVDVDRATIETARVTVGDRCPNVTFEASDAVRFLEGDIVGRFDAIVCFEGLEHLPELEAAVGLLGRAADRGVRLLVSLPNDKLTGVQNPFHVTMFGYDEATRLFAELPSVVLVPQFLAEGSLLCPPSADGVDVELTLEDRREPEYANHFVFCAGFPEAEVSAAVHGRMHLSASPVFNRWSEDLKQGAWQLRRENVRLARERLGRGGSAAGAAVAAHERSAQVIRDLEHTLHLTRLEVTELQQELLRRAGGDRTSIPMPLPSGEVDAVVVEPIYEAGQDDPNSWETRRLRAAGALVPWIEAAFPLEGRTVLEYGCGNAAVSCAFAERAGRVIGIDFDEQAIEMGRKEIGRRLVGNVELDCAPLAAIPDAVARRRGEVDVFLLYAVLEHMTVAERLAVLELAREVVRPDGVIVVCETPNRLITFDHHTGQIPYLHALPAELALRYYDRSDRAEFVGAIDAAVARGEADALEALTRWGRGVSFHEFECVFGRLDEHVIASSYDPLLFGERPIHPEDVALSRYLGRVRPDLPPNFSRYWLDVILAASPVQRRPPLLRPWVADTSASSGVGFTAWENLHLVRPGSTLRVDLPAPTSRLVLGSVTLDGHWVTLRVLADGADGVRLVHHRAPAGRHAYSTCVFDRAVRRITVEASAECQLVFVGYES